MKVQVAIMAAGGRPKVLKRMLDRFVDRVDMSCHPRIYFAGVPTDEFIAARVAQGFEIVTVEPGKPYLPSFWRVLNDAEESRGDLLFFESDVWMADNAWQHMTADNVPEWAGLVSYFDYRNDTPKTQWWRMPAKRLMWGTQAIRIPVRVLPRLHEMVEFDVELNCPCAWDEWIGHATERFGDGIALYSPSQVQHIGLDSEIYPGAGLRTTATNFLERWPKVRERSKPIQRNCNVCGETIGVCPHPLAVSRDVSGNGVTAPRPRGT